MRPFFLLLAMGVVGCRPGERSEPPAPSVAEARAPSAAALSAALPVPPRTLTPPSCRAVSVAKDVRVAESGGALAQDEEIPSEAWLSLGPGARLVSKDPRTTREAIFYGPARVRPCAFHREEAWLASGAFESESGAGEVPGAEEWIVSPFGVLRYNAAQVRMSTGARETSVSLLRGVAFLWVSKDASAQKRAPPAEPEGGSEGESSASSDAPWVRLGPGTARIVPSLTPSPLEAAAAAATDCAAIAARAHELTQALLLPEDGASPERASAAVVLQVKARRLSRAVCSVARLRVVLLPASESASSLASALDDADRTWTALPRAGAP